jgi:hypothetical protein
MLTDLADRQKADWQISETPRELETKSPAGATWRVATDNGRRTRPRLVLVRESEEQAEAQQAREEQPQEAIEARPRIVWGRRSDY